MRKFKRGEILALSGEEGLVLCQCCQNMNLDSTNVKVKWLKPVLNGPENVFKGSFMGTLKNLSQIIDGVKMINKGGLFHLDKTECKRLKDLQPDQSQVCEKEMEKGDVAKEGQKRNNGTAINDTKKVLIPKPAKKFNKKNRLKNLTIINSINCDIISEVIKKSEDKGEVNNNKDCYLPNCQVDVIDEFMFFSFNSLADLEEFEESSMCKSSTVKSTFVPSVPQPQPQERSSKSPVQPIFLTPPPPTSTSTSLIPTVFPPTPLASLSTPVPTLSSTLFPHVPGVISAIPPPLPTMFPTPSPLFTDVIPTKLAPVLTLTPTTPLTLDMILTSSPPVLDVISTHPPPVPDVIPTPPPPVPDVIPTLLPPALTVSPTPPPPVPGVSPTLLPPVPTVSPTSTPPPALNVILPSPPPMTVTLTTPSIVQTVIPTPPPIVPSTPPVLSVPSTPLSPVGSLSTTPSPPPHSSSSAGPTVRSSSGIDEKISKMFLEMMDCNALTSSPKRSSKGDESEHETTEDDKEVGRFRSVHFVEDVKKSYKRLREKNIFSDVTISCEKSEVEAHKLILASSSYFFSRLLERNSFRNNPHPIIILKDIKMKHLKFILDFVYTGELKVPQHDIAAVLQAGETLEVKGLKCHNPSDSQTKKRKVDQFSTSSGSSCPTKRSHSASCSSLPSSSRGSSPISF